MRIYLGFKVNADDGKPQASQIFLADSEPTQESHGHRFIYCVGPFRTMRGAEFMRDYGHNNPHCCTVYQAERLAKKQVTISHADFP